MTILASFRPAAIGHQPLISSARRKSTADSIKKGKGVTK